MDQGLIRRRAPEPLAHLLLGGALEAALLVANSQIPDPQRDEVGAALDRLLRGLE